MDIKSNTKHQIINKIESIHHKNKKIVFNFETWARSGKGFEISPKICYSLKNIKTIATTCTKHFYKQHKQTTFYRYEYQ